MQNEIVISTLDLWLAIGALAGWGTLLGSLERTGTKVVYWILVILLTAGTSVGLHLLIHHFNA